MVSLGGREGRERPWAGMTSIDWESGKWDQGEKRPWDGMTSVVWENWKWEGGEGKILESDGKSWWERGEGKTLGWDDEY